MASIHFFIFEEIIQQLVSYRRLDKTKQESIPLLVFKEFFCPLKYFIFWKASFTILTHFVSFRDWKVEGINIQPRKIIQIAHMTIMVGGSLNQAKPNQIAHRKRKKQRNQIKCQFKKMVFKKQLRGFKKKKCFPLPTPVYYEDNFRTTRNRLDTGRWLTNFDSDCYIRLRLLLSRRPLGP